jgi:hypothetical protein
MLSLTAVKIHAIFLGNVLESACSFHIKNGALLLHLAVSMPNQPPFSGCLQIQANKFPGDI